MSKKDSTTTEKAQHGGAREGAGKKAQYDGEPMKPYPVKLTARHREKLEKLGGAQWIRDRIDKAKI